jgi:hypothetical protein
MDTHGSFFRRYGSAIAGPFQYRRRNFAAGEVDVLSTQLREFPSDGAPQQPNITNARAMAASGHERPKSDVRVESVQLPTADMGRRGPKVAFVPPLSRVRTKSNSMRSATAYGHSGTSRAKTL